MEFIEAYSHKIELDTQTPAEFIALCTKAAQQLGWTIENVSPENFVASIPVSTTLSGEELTVTITGNAAAVKSRTIVTVANRDSQNYKNVTLLLSLVNELKNTPTLNVAEWLRQQNISLNAPAKNNVSEWFSYIIPTKEYFFTPILVFINVGIFILMVLSGGNIMSPDIEFMLGWGANFSANTLNGEWWRLITACFLHYGIIHLAFNMYGLLYIGILLEPIIGRWRFITAYLVAGVGGNIASLYFNSFAVGAGASGAIFGMYGAFIALLTTKLVDKEFRGAFLGSMGVFVGYNLFSGFTKSNIDNSAHIGGLLTGAIICYVFSIDFTTIRKTGIKTAKAATLGTLLIIGALTVAFMTMDSDVATYEINRIEFASLEEQSLKVFEKWDTIERNEKLKLLDEGNERWVRCNELMDIKQYNELPPPLESSRAAMFDYSILRKKQFDALRNWLVSDNYIHQEEAEMYVASIDSLLNAHNERE